MNKFFALMMGCILLASGCGVSLAHEMPNVSDDVMPSWNTDTETKIVLMDYIASVTDETGESYIPVADRIAVFDLDGTLMCETYPRLP